MEDFLFNTYDNQFAQYTTATSVRNEPLSVCDKNTGVNGFCELDIDKISKDGICARLGKSVFHCIHEDTYRRVVRDEVEYDVNLDATNSRTDPDLIRHMLLREADRKNVRDK